MVTVIRLNSSTDSSTPMQQAADDQILDDPDR
jgi:hypothetical protein